MTSYTATITIDLAPARRAGRWLELLAEHHPAVSPDALARAQITITVDDDSADSAGVRAQRLVLAAVGPVPVIALEVMTTEEFDRRVDLEGLPTTYYSTTDTARVLGVTRQRVLQLNEAGAFSDGVVVGNSRAWPQHVIHAYAESRKQGE